MSTPLISSIGPNVRLAATVMIAAPRSVQVAGMEDYRVLLLKRHGAARFMPNLHVFPGGCAETADLPSEWPTSWAAQSASPLTFATRMAAVREAYEESGIALACSDREHEHDQVQAGRKDPLLGLRWTDSQRRELLQRRDAVRADARQFRPALTASSLRPALHRMHCWSRWVTPEQERFRYDTFFYLVAASPAHLVAAEDLAEVVHADWMSPTEALSSHAEGKLALAPPTWDTLRELSAHRRLDDLLAHAAGRPESPEPLMPTVSESADGTKHFILPSHTITFDSACRRYSLNH